MRAIVRHSSVALMLVALVSRCAPPPPPPPAPVSAMAPIDGTYRGGATGSCGATEASLVLHDGQFRLETPSGLALDGAAKPDGTLKATQLAGSENEVNFTGRIVGTDLRGGSYSRRCAYAFALTRQ